MVPCASERSGLRAGAIHPSRFSLRATPRSPPARAIPALHATATTKHETRRIIHSGMTSPPWSVVSWFSMTHPGPLALLQPLPLPPTLPLPEPCPEREPRSQPHVSQHTKSA
eukprot:scaffold72449_cov30-Tisochrysis_lutea.AAC.8